MKEKKTYRRFNLFSFLAILGCTGMLAFESFFIFELYNRIDLQPEKLIPVESMPEKTPAKQPKADAVVPVKQAAEPVKKVAEPLKEAVAPVNEVVPPAEKESLKPVETPVEVKLAEPEPPAMTPVEAPPEAPVEPAKEISTDVELPSIIIVESLVSQY